MTAKDGLVRDPIEIYGSIVYPDGSRSLPRLICTAITRDSSGGCWIPLEPLKWGVVHPAANMTSISARP